MSTAKNNVPQALPASFFSKETVTVARSLLGHLLCRKNPRTGALDVFKIVETEAYTQDDPACHAYGKTTGRAACLYGAPGTAYVYFIYGMYHCLNVITEPEGVGGAVLFRALEPLTPDDILLTPKNSGLKTHGPGRLTRTLAITKEVHNGIPLTDSNSELYLANGASVPDHAVITTTRIGIRKAADYPWRFYLKDNPWVSVK